MEVSDYISYITSRYDSLDLRQKEILHLLFEDQEFFISEYITPQNLGKLVFHIHTVLQVSLARALKIGELIFEAYGLVFAFYFLFVFTPSLSISFSDPQHIPLWKKSNSFIQSLNSSSKSVDSSSIKPLSLTQSAPATVPSQLLKASQPSLYPQKNAYVPPTQFQYAPQPQSAPPPSPSPSPTPSTPSLTPVDGLALSAVLIFLVILFGLFKHSSFF